MTTPQSASSTSPENTLRQHAARREAMAVLARCDADELAALLAAVVGQPAHRDLRKPESGLLMLRGRISGDGSPFNVGELTVARAAVQLSSGETGFGYVLGRDREKARLIALCDALMQSEEHRTAIESGVLTPIRARQHDADRAASERAAATRVEFFTLVRGEDEK
jgi:alpha-D-ribose 1-methylphosphonate 5-triphosphate synthase subunit PhnG